MINRYPVSGKNIQLNQKKYGIKQTSIRWLVRHAESYIKHYKDVRLAQHSEDFVTNYLSDKCRDMFLFDWQFRQLVLALKILFTDMVHVGWAEAYAWNQRDDKVNSLSTMIVAHGVLPPATQVHP